METNETAIQYQAAEKELMKLIEAVEGIEEGDLKELEEKIYQGIFKIGRQLMELTFGQNRPRGMQRLQGRV